MDDDDFPGDTDKGSGVEDACVIWAVTLLALAMLMVLGTRLISMI